MNHRRANQVRKSYQGLESFNRNFSIRIIGYSCRIESARYDGETFSISINSGLPKRNTC